MRWFYNLKISSKLIASFMVVLVLTAMMGVFSIIQLARVNQTASDMGTRWMPSIRAVSEMSSHIANIRAAELQHVLSTSKDEMSRYESDMAKAHRILEKNRAEYEKLISSPEEAELFLAFTTQWKAYMLEHSELVNYSSENKKADAMYLLRGDLQFLFDGASINLEKLVELNAGRGEHASDTGDELYESSRLWVIGVLVTSISLGIFLAFFVARVISRPLSEAVNVASRVASGDLTSKIDVKSKDETGKLMQALKDMNDSLLQIVGDVRVSVDFITTTSKEIAAGNSELSQRTEEQASSLEETASSMEELTSTVKQNAENAKQANQLTMGARDVAMQGGDVVGKVVTTMASINESSKKIVDIISVIEGIAFQTNILALNAAVEAARAGEQGRGFSVVAGEVRTLAQRSAAAAKEIKALISDSVDKVGDGTKLVDQAGRTMSEIVTSVKRVTDIVSEISAASMEQSTGIDQVNMAITQMDEVTQQNAALVEEAAAAAESLEEQSVRLSDAVSMFKLGIEQKAVASQSRIAGAGAVYAAEKRAKLPKGKVADEPAGKEDEWKEF